MVAAVAAAAFVLTGLVAAAPASATTVHVDCSRTALQPKIDHAAAGTTLQLTGTCDGNFTIGKSLTLRGDPHATLDGQGLGSTVTINGAKLVHLTSLTVTGGFAPSGAGIDQTLGKLVLQHVTVTGNQAAGDVTVRGGGIHSTGTLSVVSSSIVGNAAFAGDSSQVTAIGAGIYAEGSLGLTSSTVGGNLATARSSASDATAGAAGVAATGTTVRITGSHIDGNRSVSSAAQQSTAEGGGIVAEAVSGQLTVTNSTISGNVATARSDKGAVAEAAGAFFQEESASITSSRAIGNRAHVVGATSAAALAGGMFVSGMSTLSAVHVDGNVLTASGGASVLGGGGGLVVGNGPVTLSNSTVSRNSATVKGVTGVFAGGGGMNASSGGVHVSRTTFDRDRVIASTTNGSTFVAGGAIAVDGPFTLTSSTVSNSFISGTIAGANTIAVQGGGVALTKPTGHATIRNSTISGNAAVAVSDPANGTSEAQGGGVYSKPSAVQIIETTIADNSVNGSGHTNLPRGGGLFVDNGSTTTLTDSILDLNSSPLSSNGQNCAGTIASGGHNVLGNVLGCTFSSSSADLLGVDPKLGPLAANGGPTRTHGLLAGSPARNHVPTSSCPIRVDQRGTHRPQGPACDSGSFEAP